MAELDDLLNESLTRPNEPEARRRRKPLAKTALGLAVAGAVRTDQSRNSVRAYAKGVQDAFQNFETAVGGRDELRHILKHCPLNNPAYSAIQKLFADTDFNAASEALLGLVCQRNNVNLPALLLAFKDAKVAQIAVDSIVRLSAHAPEVVDQIANDAKNRYDDCPVCEGTARVRRIGDNGEWALDADGEPQTQLCYQCRGTGHTFREHDAASRKHFLEMTGLVEGKKALVNQVFNQKAIITGGGDFVPGDGSFESLIKAIDSVSKPSQATPAEEVTDVPFTIYEVETKPNDQ